MKTLAAFDRVIEGLLSVSAGVGGGFLIWYGISFWHEGFSFGLPLAVLGLIFCVPFIRFILSFLP